MKQGNGVNHKCLLFIQLYDKTPYELKQKLLRILREYGLEERQHDNLIATENLLELEPTISSEASREQNPYIIEEEDEWSSDEVVYDQAWALNFKDLNTSILQTVVKIHSQNNIAKRSLKASVPNVLVTYKNAILPNLVLKFY